MKTIKKWLQGLNLKNVSDFFQIAIGLSTMSLFIICLLSPEFLRGNSSLIIEAVGLSIVAIIVWQRIKIKKLPHH